jgi:mRNA-degrading endonuclease YafQ of YafQ-DinJ toxin-antitoxin module
MVKVTYTRACKAKFLADFNNQRFSDDDGIVLKIWAREMETLGPDFIANSPQWRDHALEREWEGYRASCFSLEGRIIYRILDEELIQVCEIERITPNHDYRK